MSKERGITEEWIRRLARSDWIAHNSPNMEELENLRNEFPSLYADPYIPFECGDGWYTLLRWLSLELVKHIKSVPKHSHMEEEEPFHPTQVKEKYGTLRFYVNHECDDISDLIARAEKTSARTCEVCGEKGMMFGEHWKKTRCVKCVSK